MKKDEPDLIVLLLLFGSGLTWIAARRQSDQRRRPPRPFRTLQVSVRSL